MKKLIAVTLTACMLFITSGCTSADSADTTASYSVTDSYSDLAADTSSIPSEPTETVLSIDTLRSDILTYYSGRFSGRTAEMMSADFLDWLQEKFGDDCITRLHDTVKSGDFPSDNWYTLTGNTEVVLYDYYSGALDVESPNFDPYIKVMPDNGTQTATIRMTGDVSFADNWHIAPKMDERGKGLSGVMSDEVISLLGSADITLINNEFTYSTRGEPLKNKMYTFRADPSRAALLNELGVDIVSLANNHAYDYGPVAFADTLETLKEANIAYIGGGENIDEACKPYYFIIGGRKFAFTAATKAEKYKLTPEATKNSSGVLRTYDPEKYLKVIAEAEQNCDYNIAYVHWGKEGSHEIEEGLRELGAQFIDAGADIVVGAHAHLLQGIEYYRGRPIVFNLGNFLFNAKTMDSGILELTVDALGEINCKFIPCIQSGCYVKTVSGTEKQRILNFLGSLSNGVIFNSDGHFKENDP